MAQLSPIYGSEYAAQAQAVCGHLPTSASIAASHEALSPDSAVNGQQIQESDYAPKAGRFYESEYQMTSEICLNDLLTSYAELADETALCRQNLKAGAVPCYNQ